MRLQSFLPTAIVVYGMLFDQVSTLKPGSFGQKFREPHQLTRRSNTGNNGNNGNKKGSGDESFRFLTEHTKPYVVESLPDVNFNIGELYSGLVPIDNNNDSRALFFVFQPTVGEPVDEITIWLNGGPGCSSLEGFFQENGRFLWQPGTYAPVENPYSWVNLTNMLWVDQPVGTGFSIGTPTATTQEETAQDFVKFFKNFQQIFGIRKFKIYVTGESYAGRYVPYISAAMLDQNDKTFYDLSGALVYDPCIGQFDFVQEEVPTVPFVQENANLFNFNASFMAELQNMHESCGYQEYIDQYLTFPPSGVQPPSYYNYSTCDVFDLVFSEAFNENPCFNIYHISDMCPLPWDVLGFPGSLMYLPPGATIYFDRADVKAAMHAPNTTWSECGGNPFVGGYGNGPEGEGDFSADPIQQVLPQVIEATNRVLIGNGDFDMIILTNGTLMSIQNMTWNGQLGFQERPSTPINVELPDLMYMQVFDANGYNGLDGPEGVMGIQHYERGLMFVETFQSGHMQPEYQPRVSYHHLQWLLGRIDAL